MNIIKKTISFVMDTLETIVFMGSIFIVTYLFIAFPTGVQGSSMEPTVHNGDRVIASKISYKMEDIKHGDIAVVQSPVNPDINLIKRIIALENDSLSIKEGQVFLNGKPLTEDYLQDATPTWFDGFIKEGETIVIPKGYVFVMGDNRPRSSDSREFGPIPVSSVIGKVIYRYFPPDKMGVLDLL